METIAPTFRLISYWKRLVLVDCSSTVLVCVGDRILAKTTEALRLLETASPPTYYLPPDAVDWSQLVPTADRSFCEWKGLAAYWALTEAPEEGPVAWSYENPKDPFTAIDGFLSCYPGRIPCYVDDERVRPQPGLFYGGWVTSQIVGPIKGPPGTAHW